MLRLLRQPGVRVTTRSIAQQRIQYKGLFYGPTDESKDKDSASQPGDNNRLWDRVLKVWDRVNKLDDRAAGLRKDFGDFKGDVSSSLGDVHRSIDELATAMERGFGEIRAETHEHRAEAHEHRAEIRADMGLMKADMSSVKADMGSVKADMGSVKEDIGSVKADIGSVKADNTSGIGELEFKTKIEGVKSDLKRTKWQVRLLFGVVILCVIKDYGSYKLNMEPKVTPDQKPGPRKWPSFGIT